MASNSSEPGSPAVDHGHVSRMQELHRDLSENIAAKGVATRMFEQGALTKAEFESIQCARTPCNAAEALLSILEDQSYDKFRSFLEALKESNRDDVYECLIYQNLDLPVHHSELIRRHYTFLLDTMETKRSGLIAELYADKVLDITEKEHIMAEGDLSRNQKLLEVLSRKSPGDYKRFLDALRRTGQQHVADVIRDPNNADEPGEDWKGKFLELQKENCQLREKIRLLEQRLEQYEPEETREKHLELSLEQTHQPGEEDTSLKHPVGRHEETTEKQLDLTMPPMDHDLLPGEEDTYQKELEQSEPTGVKRLDKQRALSLEQSPELDEEDTVCLQQPRSLGHDEGTPEKKIDKRMASSRRHDRRLKDVGSTGPELPPRPLRETKENETGVLRTLADGEPIDGVAQLDNDLYVLRRKADDQIEVYNTQNFSLQRRVTLPGLLYLADLAACQRNRCLYIPDYVARCVHRLDDVDNPTSWLVHDEPVSLSVTAAFSVLVTCRVAGKLKEFSTRGDLIREIPLQSDVENPWHAIQLLNGQFVVCHGWTEPKPKPLDLHRACLVSDDGKNVVTYGERSGSAVGQMNTPLHLAVDGDQKSIYVADATNGRVLVLSPKLEYIREAASRDHGLKWLPCKLFINMHENRLYVAEKEWSGGMWTAGRLVVFRL